MRELYPDVRCALNHRNAFELLVATILSAQTTDERVNMVTPALFAKYPTPADLAHADPADVEQLIMSTGFFRSKTKSIIGMAQAVEARYGGEVPTELDDLVTLPGVGRKTGNVVRSVWFGLPGLPVDTHVTRLSHRLKLTNETDPVKIELDLNGIVAPDERGKLSLRLIEHGRQVCDARRPALRRLRPRRHLPLRRQGRRPAREAQAQTRTRVRNRPDRSRLERPYRPSTTHAPNAVACAAGASRLERPYRPSNSTSKRARPSDSGPRGAAAPSRRRVRLDIVRQIRPWTENSGPFAAQPPLASPTRSCGAPSRRSRPSRSANPTVVDRECSRRGSRRRGRASGGRPRVRVRR